MQLFQHLWPRVAVSLFSLRAVLVLDSIHTRFTKRLCYRPQISEAKARESRHPGRWNSRQVRLAQPGHLPVCTLAVSVEYVHLYELVGPLGDPRRYEVRRQQEPVRHGAGWPVGHHPRRSHVGPHTRQDSHRICPVDLVVPLELPPAAGWDHWLPAPYRRLDVEPHVPYERPGVLDPLIACIPWESPGAPRPKIPPRPRSVLADDNV